MVLRFDPFSRFDQLAEQMFRAASGTGAMPTAMPVDLYQADDHYVLHCDLPGVDPDSVDVSVEGNTLTITAQRTPRTGEDLRWLARERSMGLFQRQFALAEGLDVDRITATYEHGVLTVTVPVSERARPRRIQIRSGEAGPRVLEGTATESRTEAAAVGGSTTT